MGNQPAYTKTEEECLVAAFVEASECPVKGTDRTKADLAAEVRTLFMTKVRKVGTEAEFTRAKDRSGEALVKNFKNLAKEGLEWLASAPTKSPPK